MPRRVDLGHLGSAGTRQCIRHVCKHCEHSTAHTRNGLLRVSFASGAHSTLRCTPAGVPETASNELAMYLAGIGESSKAIMISNRAERIERALVGDKAFRRTLMCHTSLYHWCVRITLCCVRTNRHAWVAARVMVASETAVQERATLHADRGARFTLIEKVWQARLGRTERLAP